MEEAAELALAFFPDDNREESRTLFLKLAQRLLDLHVYSNTSRSLSLQDLLTGSLDPSISAVPDPQFRFHQSKQALVEEREKTIHQRQLDSKEDALLSQDLQKALSILFLLLPY